LAKSLLHAQGTLADYQRGQSVARTAPGLMVNVPGTPNWIESTDHFWYTRSAKGGTEFFMWMPPRPPKSPPSTTKSFAAAISKASGKAYTA